MVEEYLKDVGNEAERKQEVKKEDSDENINDAVDDLLNNEFNYLIPEENRVAEEEKEERETTSKAIDDDVPLNSNNSPIPNQITTTTSQINRIPTIYNQNIGAPPHQQQIRFINHQNRFRMHHFPQQQQPHPPIGYNMGPMINRHPQSQYLVGAPLGYYPPTTTQQQPHNWQPSHQYQRYPIHHHQQQHFQSPPINVNNHVEISTIRESKSRR